MMYCVGHTTTYRKLLKEHEQKGLNLKKLGVRDVTDNFPDGYYGGGAFSSIKDAFDFIKYTGYEGKRSVFEMGGDYDTDTYQVPGEPFRRIITDKIIFREVTAEEISDKNTLTEKINMKKITINILFDDDDTNDFECELLRTINTSTYNENIKSFVISRTEATKDEIEGLSSQRIINIFKIYVLANTDKKVTFDDIHTDDNDITHGTHNDNSYLNFGRITNVEAVKSIFEKLK